MNDLFYILMFTLKPFQRLPFLQNEEQKKKKVSFSRIVTMATRQRDEDRLVFVVPKFDVLNITTLLPSEDFERKCTRLQNSLGNLDFTIWRLN